MLKKISPFIFAVLTALTLTLAPVQSAAAWNKVCMHMPAWKSGFSATFHVLYDFNTRRGIPKSYHTGGDRHNYKNYQDLPHALNGKSSAKGRISSSQFGWNGSRCVDTSKIPNGKPFVVYVRPETGAAATQGPAAVCATHESNPKPWYFQRPGKFRHSEMWYKTGGGVWGPWCHFTHTR